MKKNGTRLSFLAVEAEEGHPVSTRKLLLESAKHTVITAYSAEEGLEMLKRFPKVDAVVIDSELKGAKQLAEQVRAESDSIRIVCLDPRISARCSWADKTVSTHDPGELLKMMEELGGRTDI